MKVAVRGVPVVDQKVLAEAFEDQTVAVRMFVIGGTAATHRRDEIVFFKPGRHDHPTDGEMAEMPFSRRGFRLDGRIIEDREKYLCFCA